MSPEINLFLDSGPANHAARFRIYGAMKGFHRAPGASANLPTLAAT